MLKMIIQFLKVIADIIIRGMQNKERKSKLYLHFYSVKKI